MANGHVFKLVEELFRPVETALDTLFYAGVLYGGGRITVLLRDLIRGVRTFFLPLGNYNRSHLPKEFGKWAVITCGTSGIGTAFAHEVSLVLKPRCPKVNSSPTCTRLYSSLEGE